MGGKPFDVRTIARKARSFFKRHPKGISVVAVVLVCSAFLILWDPSMPLRQGAHHFEEPFSCVNLATASSDEEAIAEVQNRICPDGTIDDIALQALFDKDPDDLTDAELTGIYRVACQGNIQAYGYNDDYYPRGSFDLLTQFVRDGYRCDSEGLLGLGARSSMRPGFSYIVSLLPGSCLSDTGDIECPGALAGIAVGLDRYSQTITGRPSDISLSFEKIGGSTLFVGLVRYGADERATFEFGYGTWSLATTEAVDYLVEEENLNPLAFVPQVESRYADAENGLLEENSFANDYPMAENNASAIVNGHDYYLVCYPTDEQYRRHQEARTLFESTHSQDDWGDAGIFSHWLGERPETYLDADGVVHSNAKVVKGALGEELTSYSYDYHDILRGENGVDFDMSSVRE